jgi:hypothetical protein
MLANLYPLIHRQPVEHQQRHLRIEGAAPYGQKTRNLVQHRWRRCDGQGWQVRVVRCDPGRQPFVGALLDLLESVTEPLRAGRIEGMKAREDLSLALGEGQPIPIAYVVRCHGVQQALQSVADQISPCSRVPNDPNRKPVRYFGRYLLHQERVQGAVEEQGIDQRPDIRMLERDFDLAFRVPDVLG